MRVKKNGHSKKSIEKVIDHNQFMHFMFYDLENGQNCSELSIKHIYSNIRKR